ncbi:hypothetical protein ADK41_28465 [Streptomyces caelestis]|uniref:HTH marR-type domain-containing protein n=2 Tax=Streptomyces TaxID=1883 RepID=A0A0M9X6U6_9ACTN|nr:MULTISPECIES: helix-turn-helix domain-containing protein [Streptomyces]KOT33147.1 hypothetical protein ADK41_28465 [Streptomyces caelestis]
MTAQPVEEHAAVLDTWLSPNVFAFMPSVPGPALRVLFFLLGVQEPGGRIVITQKEIAEAVGLKRSAVGGALQHLQFARMVTKVQSNGGVYSLHPQIAAFPTPAEADDAVRQLSPDEYLDVHDFEERYQRALAAHQRELRRKTEERQAPAMPPTDLAAHRRRRTRP